MNKSKFNKTLLLLATTTTIILIGMFYSGMINDVKFYDIVKDASTLIATIFAAILAYTYQNHIEYKKDIKGLWSNMVETIQYAIQYTHHPQPSYELYSDALRRLSIVIDENRGVFKNRLKGDNLQTYPFHELKKIAQLVQRLGYDHNTPDYPQRQTATRAEIVTLWKSLRDKYILELDLWDPAYYGSPLDRIEDEVIFDLAPATQTSEPAQKQARSSRG